MRFCDEVKTTVVPLVHAIGERGQQPDADFFCTPACPRPPSAP